MKVIIILDTTQGEVLLHYYNENIVDDKYDGDIESYLIGEEIIPNISNYHWMCTEQLVINTI